MFTPSTVYLSTALRQLTPIQMLEVFSDEQVYIMARTAGINTTGKTVAMLSEELCMKYGSSAMQNEVPYV